MTSTSEIKQSFVCLKKNNNVSEVEEMAYLLLRGRTLTDTLTDAIVNEL